MKATSSSSSTAAAHSNSLSVVSHLRLHISRTRLKSQPRLHISEPRPNSHLRLHISGPRLNSHLPLHISGPRPNSHLRLHISGPRPNSQPRLHILGTRLKGVNTTAQGNALGISGKRAQALKGRHPPRKASGNSWRGSNGDGLWACSDSALPGLRTTWRQNSQGVAPGFIASAFQTAVTDHVR
jgi:hypothetical protein